jgi:hypothetical protein
LFLVASRTAFGIHQPAEIRSDRKRFMNLSVEMKVAIAVATSFVVLMVGAMAAQG